MIYKHIVQYFLLLLGSFIACVLEMMFSMCRKGSFGIQSIVVSFFLVLNVSIHIYEMGMFPVFGLLIGIAEFYVKYF